MRNVLKMIALALSALIATEAQARPPEGGGAGRKTITLAYFADLHAQLEPHPELFWSEGRDETATAGGVRGWPRRSRHSGASGRGRR